MPNPRPSNSTALAVLVGVLVAVPATAQDHKPESNASKSAAHDTTAPAKPAARDGKATAKEAKPPAKPAVREARPHTDEASHDSKSPAPAARAERTRRTESSVRSRRAARRAADPQADAEHAGEAEGHGARDAHASVEDGHAPVEGDKPTVMASRARRRAAPSTRRVKGGVPAEQVAEAVAHAAASRQEHASPLHNQPAAAATGRSAAAPRRAPTPRARVAVAPRRAVQAPVTALRRYDVAWPTRSVAIEWPRTADHAALQWPAASGGDTDASTITLKWQGAATSELNRGAAAVAR